MPVLSLCLCLYGAAFTTTADAAPPAPVQTYVDQAVPVMPPSTEGYYDTPLNAGTLTLQDVLDAHKPIEPPPLPAPKSTTAAPPLLAPQMLPSSTGQMMSQGMKDVLQKVGQTPSPATPAAPAPQTATTVNGVKYEPGQEPKNLATALTGGAAPTITEPSKTVAVPTTQASATATTPGCNENTQQWEKSCAEVGYPASYVGKIVGQTKTSCTDGTLHDFWVSNTCAPQAPLSAATASTDGMCGTASNGEYNDAPKTELCAQGVASAVSGSGPWTWACSGVNGGQAAACTARMAGTAANGACGSANGVAAASAPSTNLCATGYATTVKGSGPWTWTCKGVGGGGDHTCVAPISGAAAAASVATAGSAVSAQMPSPSSSGKSDLCGAASETLAYEAPDKDLCRAGTASAVNGDGPWTWSCTDNDGTTSSCRTLSLVGTAAAAPAPAEASAPSAAPQAAVSPAKELPVSPSQQTALSSLAAEPSAKGPACGLSASQPVVMAPTTDLCEAGKASAVHGVGPWHWTCSKGRSKISCTTPKSVDGACGPSNGQTLQSAPFSGLCSSGTPDGIVGDGPWSWHCNGSGGGVNASCAATAKNAATDQVSAPVVAAATAPAPQSDVTVGKTDGKCGVASGQPSTSQPAEDLCVSGRATVVLGDGPWNWNCVGDNGGITASCTAPTIAPAPGDGECGGANGVATRSLPANDLCAAGIPGRVKGKGPWTWTCAGTNGGNSATCKAPLASKGSAAKAPPISPGDDLDSIDQGSSAHSDALPSPSKSFDALPTPSAVPPDANVRGDAAPETVPGLGEGSTDLTPPAAVESAIVPAPALKENPQTGADHGAGSHLVLDPTISTILFTRGSAAIDDQVLTTLDKLAAVLVANPDVRITLIAYADNTGTMQRDARRLSLNRATAVRDYLAGKKIAESRIDIRAEGSATTSGYVDRVDVKVND